MGVQINWLAVGLATLSSFVVGMIWYAKPVFGNTWMKLVDMTDEKQKKGMMRAMCRSLVASFLTAFVLAHVVYLANQFYKADHSFFYNAMMTAGWLWLGFAAATIVRHDSFEQRRSKLTLINLGSSLVTILVMGAIIGGLGV